MVPQKVGIRNTEINGDNNGIVYSFNKYFLITSNVPGTVLNTVLGTENIGMN